MRFAALRSRLDRELGRVRTGLAVGVLPFALHLAGAGGELGGAGQATVVAFLVVAVFGGHAVATRPFGERPIRIAGGDAEDDGFVNAICRLLRTHLRGDRFARPRAIVRRRRWLDGAAVASAAP